MRTKLDLSGYWQGRLVLNEEIDVAAPPAIEQDFFIPLPWNLQIHEVRWPNPETELSGIIRPIHRQMFRDISRKFNEGVITYRRTISIDADRMTAVSRGTERAFLTFAGSNYHTEVAVNGQPAGVHDGGHLGFEFDINALLHPGENTLEITVDNRRGDGTIPTPFFNWQNYGGVYRPLAIEWRPAVYLSGCRVSPGKDVEGWFADIAITLSQSVSGRLAAEIRSGEGRATEEIVLGDTTEYCFRMRVADPLVWQPGEGCMSTLSVRLLDGEMVRDEATESFGFRTIEARGREILINNEPVRFLGVCWHEYHPTFGNSIPPWQVEQDLRLMRYCGLNAIRATHYPHAQTFYEACDRHGIMVLAELPCWQINPAMFQDAALREFACQYAGEMVTGLGNHPSIVGWILQNESENHSPGAVEFFTAINNTFKTADPMRLTISASESSVKPAEHLSSEVIEVNDSPSGDLPPTAEIADVVGYHGYEGWYGQKADNFGKALDFYLEKLPGRPLLMTEGGAEGIPGHRSLTMEPWTEDYQAALVEHHLREVLEREEMAGFFLWLWMDYECSSTTILGINSKGLVSPERKPKLAFHIVKHLLAEYRSKRMTEEKV